ncbi:MAG: hypothetical protein LBL96_02145 [Clostridiales bacterium]|jgi:hypothetical protein|nr:hypothetical protein [Clostridiales bacterium]
MNISVGKIKNASIVILSLIAIALLSQLWLSNIPLNYFTNPGADAVSTDYHHNFIKPYRIITSHGGNMFTILYNDYSQNVIAQACVEALTDALKRNVSVTGNLDMSIINEPGFIFEYKFSMPSDYYKSALDYYGPATLPARFDYVMFIPVTSNEVQDNTDGDGTGRVIFISEAGNGDGNGVIMVEFSTQSELPPVPSPSGVRYEASAVSQLDVFTQNAFIATRPASPWEYPAIEVVNPYVNGELLLSAIEDQIDIFFLNPASKMATLGVDDVYTYSDEYTVVKYYQNDVLDYSNYRAGETQLGFLRSFELAYDFIMKDPLVNNEFFLSAYEETDSGTTFFFDYAIKELPILLPDDYKKNGEAELKSAIEITVRDDLVSHYRKLVYNYKPGEAGKTARIDFGEALDVVGSPGEQGLLTDVTLGYKIDREKQVYLYWVLQTSGGSLSRVS